MHRLAAVVLGLVVAGNASLTAQAADLPVKAFVKAPVVVPFSWTGLYVGGHAGGLNERSRFGDSPRDVLFPGFVTLGGIPALAPIVLVPSRFGTIPASSSSDFGFVGGGQAGYNWQINRFVLGAEGDISWVDARSTAVVSPIDPFAIQTLTGRLTTSIDWTASIRARAGYTFDRVLVYATGGVAFIEGRVNSSFTLTNPITGIFFPIPFAGTTFAGRTFTDVGWTIGGGVEWAFSDKWSIAGEYRYSDFGRRTVTLANTDPGGQLGILQQNVSMKLTTQQATLRLNYRIGGP